MSELKQDISKITHALDWAYNKAVNGVGILGTAQDMGEEYLDSNRNRWAAASSLIRWQNTKTAASGFATGLGGIATLPVAIPADMVSSLYIQIKMIAAIAHIGGYDIKNDKVKALAFLCLIGDSFIKEALSGAGVQFTQRFATSFIQKQITGEMLKKINQFVGFRLVTKAGSTGIVNLTKCVPFIGGIAGGSFNLIVNNRIGNVARNNFIGENEENIFQESHPVQCKL